VGRDSLVHTATRYGPESNPDGSRFSASVQTDVGAKPASYSVGTGFLQGVKRSSRGADHPPSSITVEYSCTSTPLWAFLVSSRVSLQFAFKSTCTYSFKNATKTCKLRDSDADMRADLFLMYFMSLHQW
jgi:hypothetical protein